MALLIGLSAVATSAQEPAAPVLSLSFDADQGGVVDRQEGVLGSIVPGQLGPLRGQGVQGGAIWFFGRPDECVSIPARSSLDLTRELTFTAWIWPARLGSFQTILWKGDRHDEINRINYRFSLRPEGRLEFTFKGPAGELYYQVAPEPIVVGRWSRVAVTYKRGIARLFINGRIAAKGRMGSDLPATVAKTDWQGDHMLPNHAPLEIGRGQERRGGAGQSFYGAIDEVRIWPVALATLPDAPAPPEQSPLRPLLLWERDFDAAELTARPYLTGQVHGGEFSWILVVDFPGFKDRGIQLPGRSDAKGRFCYLLNDLGGVVDLLDAQRITVRAYRRAVQDQVSLSGVALSAGQPTAHVVVDPEKPLQVVRAFGAYADVPKTFLTDPAAREAQYGPILAELKEIGITHLDLGVLPGFLKSKAGDPAPRHVTEDDIRARFTSDANSQTLVKYLRYLESQGFAVGLRLQGYARWQWLQGPGAQRTPDVEAVAEFGAAVMKAMVDAGVHLSHFVPVWEPSYAPEAVAEICAKTARLARKRGIDTPIVGPYVFATGGQSVCMDSMPNHYETGRRYTEAYLKIAGDACDAIGMEDYASGCGLIEPNLRRLWREVITPGTASGRPKELWMLEYGASCGPAPWNFYPSRWHGSCATYDSAFRLARCLHQQLNGGVSEFFYWKAYDVVGDGNLISCCGLIKSSLHDCERRPPFYTARMFWKHIPCGARHVACTSEADVLANALAKDGRFTVVLTNPRPTAVRAEVTCTGQRLAPVALLYSSTEKIKYQEREVAARGDTVSSLILPPRSVNTVVCRAAHVTRPFHRTVWDDAPRGTVYLSDLEWSAVSRTGKSGLLYSSLDATGVNVAADASLLRDWIVIGGVRYRKGLGTSAPANVLYDLDQKYASFDAIVGLDDAGQSQTTRPEVLFEVYVDGKKSFSSGPISHGMRPQTVHVPCSRTKQLRLVVTAGSTEQGVLADWGDARLTTAPPPAR